MLLLQILSRRRITRYYIRPAYSVPKGHILITIYIHTYIFLIEEIICLLMPLLTSFLPSEHCKRCFNKRNLSREQKKNILEASTCQNSKSAQTRVRAYIDTYSFGPAIKTTSKKLLNKAQQLPQNTRNKKRFRVVYLSLFVNKKRLALESERPIPPRICRASL